MKLAKQKQKNIFCIEGNWNHNLKDRASIRSALDFLEHNADVKNIHRNCSTKDQFQDLLKTSLQKTYSKYSIIYLGFHGNPGLIHVGKRQKILLNEIAEIIEDKAQDKIIHFGSCSTLNVSGWEMRRFLKQTGALAVSGYKKDIEFIASTFLDILYFRSCQNFRKISSIDNEMKKFHGKFRAELGFAMHYL